MSNARPGLSLWLARDRVTLAWVSHKRHYRSVNTCSDGSTVRALPIEEDPGKALRPAAAAALPKHCAPAASRQHAQCIERIKTKPGGSPTDAMAPPGRGDWRTGGFDLAATQPASPDEKTNKGDAPKAASKLREPRLHMRGLLAKRGSALLDPQRSSLVAVTADSRVRR